MTDEGFRNGRRQMPRQRGLARGAPGEAGGETRSGEPMRVADEPGHPRWNELMEEVVAPVNIARAMKRVRQNRGSPGIDGMTCDELPAYLERNERFLREQLLSGAYQPQPVRRVTIPKPDGGDRKSVV